MKVLNLYAGIGGNRKLWEDVEVTAVEYEPEIAEFYKSQYPNDEVIIADAHEYLIDHFKEFDFIWSSPPCPTHSQLEIANARHKRINYPDMKLYQEIILLKHRFKTGLYVVENVIPYYTPLIPAQKSGRHLYWANFKIGHYDVGTPKTKLKSGGQSSGGIAEATMEEMETFLGIKVGKNLKHKYYNGHDSRRKVLRNCVHPELGLYILNCARNIITKQNEKQIDLFE